jgi:hypothetical protein
MRRCPRERPCQVRAKVGARSCQPKLQQQRQQQQQQLQHRARMRRGRRCRRCLAVATRGRRQLGRRRLVASRRWGGQRRQRARPKDGHGDGAWQTPEQLCKQALAIIKDLASPCIGEETALKRLRTVGSVYNVVMDTLMGQVEEHPTRRPKKVHSAWLDVLITKLVTPQASRSFVRPLRRVAQASDPYVFYCRSQFLRCSPPSKPSCQR